MVNKLIAFIFAVTFCATFLISSVNALEFDNKLTYVDEEKLTVDLTNWFGFGVDYGNVTLKSHKTVTEIKPVGIGKQVPMWYDFNFKEIYYNGLGEVVFFDLNTGEEVNKNYSFVQRVKKDVQVEDYVCEKKLLKNGSIGDECSLTYINETYLKWIPYQKLDIEVGYNTIGIEVDLKEGELLDAVWTIGGKRVYEHAGFNASIKNGLIAGWGFDYNPGHLTDVVGGVINMTLNSANGYPINITGKIGNASSHFDVDDDYWGFTNSSFIGKDRTLSLWLYFNGTITGYSCLFNTGNSNWCLGYNGVNSPNQLELFDYDVAANYRSGASLTGWTNHWFHVVVTILANESYVIYYNGTEAGRGQGGTFANGGTTKQGIHRGTGGGRNGGSYDEMYYWNRVLSEDEIYTMYEYGDNGITFNEGGDTPTTESPSVVLNAPIEEYNSTSYDVVFNCSANSTIGITNLSLYLNNNLNETITNTSGYQNLSFQNTKTFANGYYNWSCLASNNDASTQSSTRNFNVSVTYPAPTVVLNNPINWYNESSTNNIVFNCSANVTEGIKNLSLVINNVFNETITNSSAFQNLSLQKTINMNNSYYNWSCIGASDYVTTQSETRVLNVSVPIVPYTPQWNSTFEIGLQAYYPMDTGTGALFYDYMGNHNGSFVGNAEYTTQAIINNASYYYSGLANVTQSPPTFTSTSPFTLQAWVNVTSGSGFIFATSNDTQADKGYNILLDGSKIEVRIGDDLTNSLIVKTTNTIDLGVWNHLVVVYDGSETAGNIQIWVNGVNKSYTITTNALSSKAMTIDKLYFGSRLGAGQISGRLDEIAIWNKSLSVQDITDLYNSALGISPNQDTSGSIEVKLSSPNDAISYAENVTINFQANITTSYANMTNASLYIWNSNQSVYNLTTNSISGRGTNISTYSVSNIDVGNYNWNVYACSINDTSSTICSFSLTNRTFSIKSFSETSEYFENNVYETDNTNFELNVTTELTSTLYSALLNYSGVNYEAIVKNNGGGSYTIKRNLDVPIILANKSNTFNWILSVNLDGSFINQVTTMNYQNVTKTLFLNNANNFALNYTIKNEESDELVSANIYSLLNWYLGRGGSIQNNTFILNPTSTFYLNKFPQNNNLTYSHRISLSNATIVNETYYLRTFDFLNENWTKTTNRVLYLLPTGNGTEFTITLKDTGLKALPGYLIKVYRFYPETNTYKLIESKETDYFGQIPVYVRQRDTRYKIDFYNDKGEFVKTTDNVYFICKSLVTCSSQFILQNDADILDRFGNLTDYDYIFRFLNDTNSFEFVWNDNTGKGSVHNLIIEKKLFNGTTIVFNQNSTNNPGILTYTITSDEKATYIAKAIRYSGNTERIIGIINQKLNDYSDRFGLEGLLWGIFLLLTLILIGVYHPPTAIILYLVGFFLLGILDIININPVVIAAQLVIGIAFIIAFRS